MGGSPDANNKMCKAVKSSVPNILLSGGECPGIGKEASKRITGEIHRFSAEERLSDCTTKEAGDWDLVGRYLLGMQRNLAYLPTGDSGNSKPTDETMKHCSRTFR